jgi:glucokinase
MTAAQPPLLLALDFGGTKLTAGTVRSGQRTWLGHRRTFSPADADQTYEYAAMVDLARELISDTGQHPAAVGVSFGGPVYPPEGLVRLSHHVAGWENVPLADWLQAAFNVPVAVDNDANVAALGEFRLGAGQNCQSLLYVTVSTGIGGGWLLNGRPYGGDDGMAGELGHMIVQPGGLPCVCGRRGCLEAEACGPAIAYRARMLLAEADDTTGAALLSAAGGDLGKITAQLISQTAAEGDAFCRQVLAESAARLGLGLANVVNLMNPERIILGGGVTKAGEFWWETVRRTARANVLPEIRLEIVPATLGDDAPLWGAVALAERLLTDP